MTNNSFYEMCLQGIMVVVFIILDWMFFFNEYNTRDSLQAGLID